MKRILIAGLIAAAPLMAQADETGPGCGLGSMVFDGKDGVASHVLAVTTNGTSGNQTFGMTSGTLGCDVSKPVKFMAYNFLDSNIDKVARDMATGNGESLNTLAGLLGVQDSDKEIFFQASQDSFATIFSRDDVKSNEVYAAIIAMMRNHSTLAQYAG